MHRFGLGVLVLAACSKSAGAPAPAVSPDGWLCFARDPAATELAQGSVSHVRQRVIDGRLETESVFVQAGRGGASRLVFQPAGDHLEAVVRGVPATARLLAPDGSHWVLSYSDPARGLTFSENSMIASDVLTVTSIDASAPGPTSAPVRFLAASCDVVVAELAKYP